LAGEYQFVDEFAEMSGLNVMWLERWKEVVERVESPAFEKKMRAKMNEISVLADVFVVMMILFRETVESN
jgi:hypothetical protein